MYKHACSIGLEGLVSKVRDSPYVSGRTHDWAKKTCAQREIAPDRWLCPRWQRIRRHLSCPPKRQGPGLCRQGRSRFYHTSANDLQARLKPLIRKTQPYTKKTAHRGIWVEPELSAEIEYRAKSAEGKVRHPLFKGLREDL
jgi:bifunctional non-homologous end joining protein LigD